MAKQDRDEWVIGTWHVYHHVELHAVPEKDGRPRPDALPSSAVHQWYRWGSYHAARKFQRENPALEGYVIVNLSRLDRQCHQQYERRAQARQDNAGG